MAREWDFFISHASEDKETVARPLAEELMHAGFRVWLDAFELKVGDSLRGRIDEGLARSQFGIVILSAAFFAKQWTSAELGALFALENMDERRVLPVRHKIHQSDIARHSPLLADRVALDARIGSFHLARAIVEQHRDRLGAPQTVQRHLVSLIERGVVDDLAAFLKFYPYELAYASAFTGSAHLTMSIRPEIERSESTWSPHFILETLLSPTINEWDTQ